MSSTHPCAFVNGAGCKERNSLVPTPNMSKAEKAGWGIAEAALGSITFVIFNCVFLGLLFHKHLLTIYHMNHQAMH